MIFTITDGRGSNIYYDEYLRDWNINFQIKESLMEAYISRKKRYNIL